MLKEGMHQRESPTQWNYSSVENEELSTFNSQSNQGIKTSGDRTRPSGFVVISSVRQTEQK